MRVIIDAVSIESGGGRRYFGGVVPSLAAQCPDWKFLVFVKRGVSTEVEAVKNVSVIGLPLWLCGFPFRLITQQCAVPLVGWITRANVVLSLSDLGPIWSPLPVIATIANAFIYRALSKLRRYKLRKADLPFRDRMRTFGLAALSRLFLKTARGLVYWTEASKAEVELLTGKCHRSVVVYNGEPFQGELSSELCWSRQEQIVCVSTIVRYKNQLQLVRAFHQLLQSDDRIRKFSLVLIGNVCDVEYAALIKSFIAAMHLQDHVRILGDVSYDVVLEYYRTSWVLAFPSRVETYGFPVVEGLFSEIPMCLSDIQTFRELAGDCALYFDPNKPESIADTLQRLIFDTRMREALVQASRRQREKYAWKETGLRVARFMEQVIADERA